MDEGAVVIRDIADAGEMRAVEQLQKEVWGMSDRDVVSVFMLTATVAAGGVLVGAFDGPALVGFAYGFVGLERGRPILHSDMLAVLPAYRRLGLGRRLKLAQRERALARGLRVMTWTFDPLQARNARLNFARLGVLSDRYLVNFYGEHSSSFLHATGTDRLWVTWLLDSPRVRERIGEGAAHAAAHAPARATQADADVCTLVRVSPGDAPEVSGDGASPRGRLAVEIPADINELQERAPALAHDWRSATRRAFTDALAAGHLVEDFLTREREGRRVGVYLLTPGARLEDFGEHASEDFGEHVS